MSVLAALRLSLTATRPVARSIHCNVNLQEWTKNQGVHDFIDRTVKLCQPDKIHVCDGSDAEWNALCGQLAKEGVFTPLKKRENSYWARTDPSDVARVEDRTYICSKEKADAGPTNNWIDPTEIKGVLNEKFSGAMKGRTLYVVPFSMGPLGSSLSALGVQLTDSAYAAVNMQIMTRMGSKAIQQLGKDDTFVPALHSIGAPLKEGQKDSYWPCSKEKYICHFPEERSIISFGSGYGGNALLSKKCYALRIASTMARDNGWLAEHMLIMGLTNPEGKKKYFAAAFPSACGKTNLAMLNPTLPGWKVEVVGDDICWMGYGKDGQLYAVNPENGFFGVAPGTSAKTNPNALESLKKHTIFTNTGLTPDGDVWWEGIGHPAPAGTTTWLGQKWDGQASTKIAHPNSRFTAPVANCPIVDPAFDDPKGVPISGIIFGGRRPSLIPVVYETFDWNHGTLAGAMVSSETTAAAIGQTGVLRHDPFAMLPFCGYNMGDYFGHWLKMGTKSSASKLPKIFHVNWFRQGADGHFMWPGFGENSRVLKWMFERSEGTGKAKKTAIGYLPTVDETGKNGGLDVSGLKISKQDTEDLLKVDVNGWKKEVDEAEKYFEQFGDRLPAGIKKELGSLRSRLNSDV